MQQLPVYSILLPLALLDTWMCSPNVRNCRKAGSDAISEREVIEFCDFAEHLFYGDMGTNKAVDYKDMDKEELDKLVFSSVLILSIKVERIFRKRVSWNACVDHPDYNTCGPEYCRLSSKKHFMDVKIQCMLVYPDVNNVDYEDTSCLTMFDRMYISSQCPFDSFHVNGEYIMFASAIELQRRSVDDVMCDVISDVTYSRFIMSDSSFLSQLLQYCNTKRAKAAVKWSRDLSVDNRTDDRCPFAISLHSNFMCSNAECTFTPYNSVLNCLGALLLLALRVMQY